MHKKKIIFAVLAIMLLATIGGAYALYTGTASKQRILLVLQTGSSDDSSAGTIEEPHWDETKATDLQPNNQHIPKDPKLKSNVDYKAWVFIKVEIPVLSGRMDADTTDKVYDAVTIDDYDTTNWELIKQTKSTTLGTNSVYIYGYKTELAAKASTTPLFTSFSVPNFTKVNETAGGKFTDSIDVSGAMISSDGTLTLDTAAAQLGLS